MGHSKGLNIFVISNRVQLVNTTLTVLAERYLKDSSWDGTMLNTQAGYKGSPLRKEQAKMEFLTSPFGGLVRVGSCPL